MKRFVVPAILVLSISACTDVCIHEEDRSAEESLDGIERVVLISQSGSLRVEGEAGSASLSAKGRACSALRSDLKDIRIEMQRDGSTLFVTAAVPDLPWMPFDLFFVPATLNLTVTVSPDVKLDVDDGRGELHLIGVGTTTVTDGSGEIVARDIRGDLQIEDGSGGIDIDGVSGDVTVRDGSGGISIANVSGSVHIPFDGSGAIAIADVRKDVKIDADGSGAISIKKVDGLVYIGSDGSGSIQISEVGGNVTIDSDGSGGIEVSDVAGDFVVNSAGSGGVRHERVQGTVKY
mgnify:CR=1 FL=1|jgi:hypothetical protein